MWENFVFLVLLYTCDVMYNWSISLMPPVVLDNLFNMLLTKFLCKLYFWILILFFYFITLNVPLVITMCTSKFSSGRGWSFLWSLELLLKFYLLCHLHRKFFSIFDLTFWSYLFVWSVLTLFKLLYQQFLVVFYLTNKSIFSSLKLGSL